VSAGDSLRKTTITLNLCLFIHSCVAERLLGTAGGPKQAAGFQMGRPISGPLFRDRSSWG
jgi:hypothetical protein